jgi:hypothetical protein
MNKSELAHYLAKRTKPRFVEIKRVTRYTSNAAIARTRTTECQRHAVIYRMPSKPTPSASFFAGRGGCGGGAKHFPRQSQEPRDIYDSPIRRRSPDRLPQRDIGGVNRPHA